MRKKETANYLWYTRNENGVKGPFTIGMVQRFVLIGRLKQDDEVSQDKDTWRRVRNTPAVIPDEMRNINSDEDQQRLLQARLREDERLKDRRRAELGEFQGRRNKQDRRQIEDINIRVHREMKSQSQANYVAEKKNAIPMTLSALLLIGLMIVGIFVYMESAKLNHHSPDCNSLPGPAVNWSHCQMEGVQLGGKDLQGAMFNNTNLTAANLANTRLLKADLAYSNLGLAVLQEADLQHASLKGANLRNADLRRSNFSAADLSYADLRNADIQGAIFKDAVLYKTIWIDGSACLPASIGRCITK